MALAPAAVREKEVRSASTLAESTDTRKVPPRLRGGRDTVTGKVLTEGAKENIGEKKRLGALPHSPSTSSVLTPGEVQMPRPLCTLGILIMEVELVTVRR